MNAHAHTHRNVTVHIKGHKYTNMHTQVHEHIHTHVYKYTPNESRTFLLLLLEYFIRLIYIYKAHNWSLAHNKLS